MVITVTTFVQSSRRADREPGQGFEENSSLESLFYYQINVALEFSITAEMFLSMYCHL
jgi:hypothetical protein